MTITNRLIEFSFSKKYGDLSMRQKDVNVLDEILDYCISIHEKVKCDSDLWNIEVEDGCLLADFLFATSAIDNDFLRRLQEILFKKIQFPNSAEQESVDIAAAESIQVALNGYSSSSKDEIAVTRTAYLELRRRILSQVRNEREYSELMPSCFPNSIFSNQLTDGFHVKNFRAHIEEITKCLAWLDENAIDIFLKYEKNEQKIRPVIEAALRESFGTDHNHHDVLGFTFEYQDPDSEEMELIRKVVFCEPHLKLIRDDSNLRIYFWWLDPDVEQGEKVLVGRIGTHPY